MLLGWLIYSMACMHCYRKYISEAEIINIRAFHFSVFTFQRLFICLLLGLYVPHITSCSRQLRPQKRGLAGLLPRVSSLEGILHMYEGKEVEGQEFFDLLNKSDEFCAELGRVVLAAGKLEGILIQVIERENQTINLKNATLGRLISYAETYPELKDLVPHLKSVKIQRNYLTHNIYQLLSDRIEETVLERQGLLDSDVHTYFERAWELKNNLNALAELVINETEGHA